MPKVHVLLKKEELDAQRLPGKVVVVLDILFATTSIVTALAHGACEVLPMLSGDACMAEAKRRAPQSYVLSGELNADTLTGFAHPTPLALLREDLVGRSLLYSTTNGTVALAKCRGADDVYAAALVNARAVVEHVLRTHPRGTILLVCSGSADNFNLEDFYGAGHLVSLFRALCGDGCDYTDAALAAGLLHQGTDALQCLAGSRVGRMMRARGLDDEIRYAAQEDIHRVVPRLGDGALRAVA